MKYSSIVNEVIFLCIRKRFFLLVFFWVCFISFTNFSMVSATSTISVSVANIISLDILPTSSAGVFVHSSTSNNTISVSTNNYTGYTLGIAASNTDDNALSLKENNTIIDSINSHGVSAGVSEANYANNDYVASNNLNNTWGYRPSTYYDASNNVNIDNTTSNLYFSAPTSTTSVTTLAKTTAPNIPDTPTATDNYNIAIGARVGLDKTPGVYTNTFVITIVANPTPYTITYDANAGSDTVTNMPTNITNGLSYANTVSLDNLSNPTIPERAGYIFAGWCTSGASETSCSSTLYNIANNNLADFPINSAASNNNINVYAIWTPTRTCTKQYRLQNADGTFPDNYTNDGTEELSLGEICTYTKSVVDYKNSASGTNNASNTASDTVAENDLILSLDFYRNTYTLTVSKGDNISAASATTAAVHDSNYYRWGQDVALSATKGSDTACVDYSIPSWTQSGTAGVFSTTSSATPTFTMGKGDSTVTAASSATQKSQTITLARGAGASGIYINSTYYTGSSVSLKCGNYSLAGSYDSGYEFSDWSRTDDVTVLNASSITTVMTVKGSGALTLNTKTCIAPLPADTGIMQTWNKPSNLASYCEGASTTLTDSRNGNNQYTVAKIGGLVWMTKNLDLPGGTTLTSSDSNVTSDYTLPDSSISGFVNTTDSSVYNSGRTFCSNNPTIGSCYSYYSWVVATAGTSPSSGNASNDICPKGWRLPTRTEFTTLTTLAGSYITSGSLVSPPFLGVYAGYGSVNKIAASGSRGDYWSSTASSAYLAYFMTINNVYTSTPGVNTSGKQSGNSVRCVAKP